MQNKAREMTERGNCDYVSVSVGGIAAWGARGFWHGTNRYHMYSSYSVSYILVSNFFFNTNTIITCYRLGLTVSVCRVHIEHT